MPHPAVHRMTKFHLWLNSHSTTPTDASCPRRGSLLQNKAVLDATGLLGKGKLERGGSLLLWGGLFTSSASFQKLLELLLSL